MPELPEVETVVRQLRNAGLKCKTITALQVLWPRTAETSDLVSAVCGRAFTGFGRRGKYILMHLDMGHLVLHLRMTGRLSVVSKEQALPYERLRLAARRWASACFPRPA